MNINNEHVWWFEPLCGAQWAMSFSSPPLSELFLHSASQLLLQKYRVNGIVKHTL